MPKPRSCFLMLIVLLVAGLVAHSRGGEGEGGGESPFALLRSRSSAERLRARALIVEARRQTLGELLTIIRAPVDEGEPFYISGTRRNLAVDLLGRLRAKEAVPELVDILLPKPGHSTDTSRLMFFGHAGYALVRIGLPSVAPVLERLKTLERWGDRDPYLRVLVAVEGAAGAEERLRQSIEREPAGKTRENLQAGLADLLQHRFPVESAEELGRRLLLLDGESR